MTSQPLTSQIFDDCALVTMTTSPSDMEDVPTDLADRIAGLTKGKFRHVALIDAHNCLTGPTTMSQEKVGALEEAALESLQRQRSSVTFKIGAAHRDSSFKLREGFGPGGILVMAVETNGETLATLSIDGNNMVKDLREQILAEIRTLGFADGAVRHQTHTWSTVSSQLVSATIQSERQCREAYYSKKSKAHVKRHWLILRCVKLEF